MPACVRHPAPFGAAGRGMRPSHGALADDVDAPIGRVDQNGGVDVTERPVIGIFGAGKVGTALARLLVASGYDVLISGSPRQTALDLLVSVVAPGTRVVSAADLVAQADVIIVAVPFGKAAPCRGRTSAAASSWMP